MNDKRCGTCHYYRKIDWHEGKYGECHAPLPASLFQPQQDSMLPTAGVDCPCWGEKEQP